MAVQPKLRPSRRAEFDVQIDAPAKINHFLHVLGRRDDGYHDLQTGFQFLSWGDTLHWRASDEFQVTGLEGVAMTDNLIWRAGQALAAASGIQPKGHLHVDKQIPAGAGLGGGSSDAASALLLLRQQWGLNVDDITLHQIGTRLGADVPIFLHGRSAIGTGIGEQLSELDWPECRIDLFMPAVHVPTRNIFMDEVLTRNSEAINIRAALDGNGHNDCEPVCRRQFPEVDALFVCLANRQPKLSGSGGTVFVLDNEVGSSEIAACQVRHLQTRTTNHSSAIQD